VIAEIVAIGSELLTPHRQDTNSLYLTEKLNQLGVEVAFKDVVGDNREHLTCTARTAIARADIVIFMGGLGPTEDDLTRHAVADALGREVHRDPVLITELYKRFAALRRPMSPNNERQAEVIEGAVPLPNARGSAPGQWLEVQYQSHVRYVMLLPGPPHEIKPMFEEQCMPRLREKLPPFHLATRVLKIAMMPESECDARVAPIYTQAREVQTTILAGAGESSCSSGRRPNQRNWRRLALTRWRIRLKTNWETTSSRAPARPWNRSWATFCKCAGRRWQWRSRAPADSSRKESPR
jgi:nicotinamide-nucleotide amidase